MNYILDSFEVYKDVIVNVIVVQGYDRANKIENVTIPDLIKENIEEEIPDQNVYFLSENISRTSSKNAMSPKEDKLS